MHCLEQNFTGTILMESPSIMDSFKGRRVIVSMSIGIEKSKQRVRDVLFWPGMGAQIELGVKPPVSKSSTLAKLNWVDMEFQIQIFKLEVQRMCSSLTTPAALTIHGQMEKVKKQCKGLWIPSRTACVA
jgi:hypothetical protein